MDGSTPRRVFDYKQASRVVAELHHADPSPGIAPPGYRLVGELGRGGCGVVYRAFREGSERPVALKVLDAILDDHAHARVWREVEALEAIALPYVPRVLDFGVHSGRMFVAADLVEGRPIDEHAAALGLPEKVRLLAAVADAVQSIHEFGVLHRDLKPSNILVTPRGQPVIIDLGLAALEGRPGDTLAPAGTPLGTPTFMAPESARGERGAISTRTDVFGLGAVAYIVLVGDGPRPAADNVAAALSLAVAGEVRDPRELNPDLPPALAAVLLKACARDPSQRYGSAGELAAELRRWLAGDRVLAQPMTHWQRLGRWARRHPRATVAATASAIGLTIIASSLATAWWLNRTVAYVTIVDGRAVLWSLAQHRLGQVESADGLVRDAELMDAAASGGRQILLTLAAAEGDPGVRLEARDVSDLRRVLWVSAATLPAEMTLDREGRPLAPTFVADNLRVADVFPDRPGDEIVVTMRHRPNDPTALQVYAADGERLMEIWQRGYIFDIAWLPAPGLLVALGVNSERPFDAMGWPVPNQAGTYPYVLWAVRPRADGLSRYLATGDAGVPADSSVAPAWYRWLKTSVGPNLLLEADFGGGLFGHDPRSHILARVQASFAGRASEAISWVVGAGGTISPPLRAQSTRAPGDPAEDWFEGWTWVDRP